MRDKNLNKFGYVNGGNSYEQSLNNRYNSNISNISNSFIENSGTNDNLSQFPQDVQEILKKMYMQKQNDNGYIDGKIRRKR